TSSAAGLATPTSPRRTDTPRSTPGRRSRHSETPNYPVLRRGRALTPSGGPTSRCSAGSRRSDPLCGQEQADRAVHHHRERRGRTWATEQSRPQNPDNLRAGVSQVHRYEPLLNRSYAEMAAHYGTAILPARAGKPRDKAKVEVGVQIAERWLLATLRNERFTSLAEANTAIAAKLAWLNNRRFAKLEGTRQSLFDQLDRPAMRPLPATRYEFATWTTPKVNIAYHVDVDRHYYSVPYQLT